jgi:hypothetical protein
MLMSHELLTARREYCAVLQRPRRQQQSHTYGSIVALVAVLHEAMPWKPHSRTCVQVSAPSGWRCPVIDLVYAHAGGTSAQMVALRTDVMAGSGGAQPAIACRYRFCPCNNASALQTASIAEELTTTD